MRAEAWQGRDGVLCVSDAWDFSSGKPCRTLTKSYCGRDGHLPVEADEGVGAERDADVEKHDPIPCFAEGNSRVGYGIRFAIFSKSISKEGVSREDKCL